MVWNPRKPVENDKPTLGGVIGLLALIALIAGFVFIVGSLL